MARYQLDVPELHRAVDLRRGERGLSWQQVGVETDLPGSFFSRLGHGYGISADALCTLLAWLGQRDVQGFTNGR